MKNLKIYTITLHRMCILLHGFVTETIKSVLLVYTLVLVVSLVIVVGLQRISDRIGDSVSERTEDCRT